MLLVIESLPIERNGERGECGRERRGGGGGEGETIERGDEITREKR